MGYIFYILLMPNFFGGINIAHVTSLLPFVNTKNKLTYKINWASLIFFAYIGYISVRLIFYYLYNIGTFIFDDFSEVERIIGLLIGYFFAKKSNIKVSKVYTIFFALALVIYFAGIHLYGNKYRFSSLMASVNYVWVPVLFLFMKGKPIIIKYELVILGSFTLFLSASMTSIVICFIFLVIGLFYLDFNKAILWIIPILVLGLFFIKFNMLEYFHAFVFNINKIERLVTAIRNGNVTEFRSLAVRINVWHGAFVLIKQNPIFGHGVAKNVLRYADNFFIMTLFRYGLIGFLLETLLLISFLYYSLKKDNLTAFLFAVGLIISGITANSIYNIKIIPILGILLGEVFKFDRNKTEI